MNGRWMRRGRVIRIIAWLALPLVFAFRPGYRATRDGMTALRRLPADVVSKTLVLPSDGDTRPQGPAERLALDQTRARSRTLARLFAVLLTVDLILWGRTVFVTGAGVLSPPSIVQLSVAIVLGSQFLILALTNWQARTGRAGSFLAFLADGRNIWPR